VCLFLDVTLQNLADHKVNSKYTNESARITIIRKLTPGSGANALGSAIAIEPSFIKLTYYPSPAQLDDTGPPTYHGLFEKCGI
jgi:hypothetical protein